MIEEQCCINPPCPANLSNLIGIFSRSLSVLEPDDNIVNVGSAGLTASLKPGPRALPRETRDCALRRSHPNIALMQLFK